MRLSVRPSVRVCVCVCVRARACAGSRVRVYLRACVCGRLRARVRAKTERQTDKQTHRQNEPETGSASAVKCNIKTQHVTIVVLNELPAADKKGTEVAVMYINPQRNATEISDGLRADYIQLLCSGTVHGVRFIITSQDRRTFA